MTRSSAPLSEDKPTSSAVLSFYDTPLNATFIEPNSAAEFSVVQDDEQGSVLKLTVADSDRINDPYVKIDYAAYMAACGLEPVAWNDCAMVLVLMKVESATNNKVEMAAYNKSVGKSKTVRTQGAFKTTETGWQYVLLPLVTDAYDGTLTELRFDFLDKPAVAGETVYVKSITLPTAMCPPFRMQKPKTGRVTVSNTTPVAVISSWLTACWPRSGSRCFFNYADEIGADGMFPTGDLIRPRRLGERLGNTALCGQIPTAEETVIHRFHQTEKAPTSGAFSICS